MNNIENIGSNLFALDLKYENPTTGGAIGTIGSYNGNISQMRWHSKYDIPRGYGFAYDPLNRLTAAFYGEGMNCNTNEGSNNTAYQYDLNGNLTSLQRKREFISIDQLSYAYYNNGSSNRLLSVNDEGTTDGYVPSSGQYNYDANGNMIYDPSKKIHIDYNHLNLPKLIEFDNDDYITYAYSASGAKLRKTVSTWKTSTGGITDYSGPFSYHDNQLSCIFTPAGRLVPITVNGNVLWKYEYNLTDHLGNVRVVFAAHSHGQPEVMQQTSYYPFGMTFQQQNFGGINPNPNKLLYNSKELQDDELAGSRLDWYDYGARFYDPQIGRWHSVDPLAGDYFSWSPYAYVMNNPIKYIDPDGMRVWPGEGTINAKNAGKVDDKTLNQIHVSQGKQSAVAVGALALAIGGYYAAPYAAIAFGNLAEKITGVLVSNPETVSLILGTISGIASEVLSLPPSTLPSDNNAFTAGEIAGTLITRGANLIIEEAKAAWNSSISDYHENKASISATVSSQIIDETLIHNYTQPADKTQHVKPYFQTP
jgi:RHS repeat-associated protein